MVCKQTTYVINLPHRVDRRMETERQLARIGWSAEFFPAVQPDEAAGFPSIGARGCFLSHLAVLQKGLAAGADRVVVLEDDVNFAAGFADRWQSTMAALEQLPWSIFYPGHALTGLPSGLSRLAPATPVRCTHFMMLEGRAIPQLVAGLQTILARPPGHPAGGPMHVDGAYSTMREQNPSLMTYALSPFLVSTCNLNFLAQSLSDPSFRESVQMSDFATADGMPVLWLARLMGIPFKARIAGSDMFEVLASRKTCRRQLKVFLFGAPEGVAEAAGSRLNAQPRGVVCVGALYPGHGSLADLNRSDFIASINASGADFLAVALGATKGQAWLRHNHQRLTVPVRAHLGAVIGFQAGVVRRAPRVVQKSGLEWLWRIKEEPYLWRRYWRDGCVLLRVLLFRVLPLAVLVQLNRWKVRHARPNLDVSTRQGVDSVTLCLSGRAVDQHLAGVIAHGRAALAADKPRLIVDLSKVDTVDARFLALLLMMRKCVAGRPGGRLEVVGASAAIKRMFRLNEVAFLLATPEGASC
jgi:N-acetylglucosaminyldiphosphoundecaprenol N-acetyl-beta-D-mannosaminyltransferase